MPRTPSGPLQTLVRVAGQRWKIEESFQTAKSQAGLDQHQVRSWTSWHRWTILAMLAMAFLAVTTAEQNQHRPSAHGLFPVSQAELRRLFDTLTAGAIATLEQAITSSIWRRKHQANAQQSHYRRRSQCPLTQSTAGVLGLLFEVCNGQSEPLADVVRAREDTHLT